MNTQTRAIPDPQPPDDRPVEVRYGYERDTELKGSFPLEPDPNAGIPVEVRNGFERDSDHK